MQNWQCHRFLSWRHSKVYSFNLKSVIYLSSGFLGANLVSSWIPQQITYTKCLMIIMMIIMIMTSPTRQILTSSFLLLRCHNQSGLVILQLLLWINCKTYLLLWEILQLQLQSSSINPCTRLSTILLCASVFLISWDALWLCATWSCTQWFGHRCRHTTNNAFISAVSIF